ncbi:Starch-binding associating with outer membrane [Pedobacter steynii]|uniref:Starch-binding associating with outer membrane n=1 Tax=Pedobacter steynii TaxID=430522 RepID=A0A1G9P1R0_9SPHI|nr:RagB/SusD family nutrient uptake outer membrane protein [Pedobacter steynii]NQX39135.1 RagB/SusD family nutrient uptake outer membrane protein [Pedobacter steynii]SDL92105.1 Starch-binding associating with outer membrane [Pedobacter steynii]
MITSSSLKIVRYIVLFAAVSFSYGCSVDGLRPEDRIVDGNFWKSAADAEAAVIGIYDKVQSLAKQDPVAFDVGSDAIDVLQVTDDYLPIDQHNITVDNPRVKDYWENNYAGIHRANDVIKHIPGINDGSFSTLQRDCLLGEAYFLRAYFYFNLLRAYGGVPLITVPYESFNADFTVPRAGVAEVYALIISDLQTAESKLLLKFGDEMQTRGRATKGAANALLAKVFLHKKDYPNAVIQATKVIENPNYGLTTGRTNYINMFTPNGRNSRESIFEIQFVSSAIEGHGLHRYYMPVANAGQIGGEYILAPTAKMINAYEAGDFRKDASIALSTNPPFRNTGQPYISKYVRTSANLDGNVIVIRLADVMLMKAEALMLSGHPAEAITLLNTIRRRAYGLDLNAISMRDYPTASDLARGYTLELAIENERFLELAFEGHRWHDLLRTGRASVVLGIAAEKCLWPIPQRERDRNPKLIQNPGYN